MTRHPIQTLEYLDILACYYEDLTILEDVNALNHTLEELGDRGLMLPLVGCECKSCFQNLLEYWVGTENLTYFVYDDPEKVQQVLAIMGQKALDTVEITLKSDAQGAIFWEDTSTTNLSPAFYEAYVEPEITAWAERFRREGNLLLQHACGHLKAVLPLMSRQGISGVESLSPAPTGNISVGEALKILPEHQALVGGLEPTFLLNSTMEQLERHVRELLALTKGRRYILANSDSCPPGVAYEKFLLLAKLARENTES